MPKYPPGSVIYRAKTIEVASGTCIRLERFLVWDNTHQYTLENTGVWYLIDNWLSKPVKEEEYVLSTEKGDYGCFLVPAEALRDLQNRSVLSLQKEIDSTQKYLATLWERMIVAKNPLTTPE